MPLDDYQRKRNRARTPEPMPDTPVPGTEQTGAEQANGEQHRDAGQAAAGEQAAHAAMFVVQEHHARRLHWDFRLERDGVLVSWAVPKGLPPDPSTNHLAVHTEDHPLSYLDFEGEIPKGNYGAGAMSVWDTGTYECEKWRPGEVIVVLNGRQVEGRYILFQTKDDQWMVHRMDPPQDPSRVPMPDRLPPMRAVLGTLPSSDEDQQFGFEINWDGVRA